MPVDTNKEIDLRQLEVIIHNKIHEYIYKYRNNPKYIKLPLWIFNYLKQLMGKVDMKLNYQTEQFEYYGLIVCETISIEKTEEIEVF